MASNSIYKSLALIGIAAASGAAWWYQSHPAATAPGAASGGTASAPAAPASGQGAGAARAPAVEVATVRQARVSDDVQAVGSLRSRQSVVLRPELSGRIGQLNMRDGERVRKGQLLVQFEDQLQQAQLKQSQAEFAIAQANHRRNQDLLAQNFISKRTVEESAAAQDVAEAKLQLAQATLARMRILAPFDGVVGIRNVSQGDYLKDGADIVNLEDIDAVYVDFRLPERYQAKVKRGQSAQVELEALPGQRFNALILATDPLIDANGRSLGVRGCLDNRQLQLRPGMFAKVRAVFGVREQALLVPEEAIVPQGQKVFVIKVVAGDKPETWVSRRVEVKLGVRQAGQVEVVEGLQPQDRVVTAGQQRVQGDGTVLKLIELPGTSAAAKPAAAASAPTAAASAPAAGGSQSAVAKPSVRPGSGASGNACLAELAVPLSDATRAGARPAAVRR